MKTYYKVLYRNGHGDLLSIGELFGRTKELIVKYNPPGEETVAPKGTKLFVFDTYEHARNFVSHNSGNYASRNLEFWEVVTEAASPPAHVLVIWRGYPRSPQARSFRDYQQVLRTFWRQLGTGGKFTFLVTYPPDGTLACNSLTLKKRVK